MRLSKKERQRRHNVKLCRERRAWYKSMGICQVCGQAFVEPGRVRCKACMDRDKARRAITDPGMERDKARKREVRQYRLENHLCLDCGAPVTQYQKCDKCRESQRFSQIKYRHNKKLQELRAKGLII